MPRLFNQVGKKRRGEMKGRKYMMISIVLQICNAITLFVGIRLIFPGMSMFFAFPMMIILVASADFIATWYSNSRDRDVFLRRLSMAMLISGFASITSMVISLIAATRLASFGWTMNWSAIVTLILISVTESLFAGRLMVEYVRQTKPDFVMKSWFWKE